MAASANFHFSPSSDNYYYNHGLPSSYYLHLQTPTLPLSGYFQAGYPVYSQTGIPLYPQGQLQPYTFGPSTIHHPARFSGRAESSGFHCLITCDDGSWVLNSQEPEYGPPPYQLDGISGWSAGGSYRQSMRFNTYRVFNSRGGEYGYQSERFSGRAADHGNYSQFTACDCCRVHDRGQRQFYSSRNNRNATTHDQPENSNYGESLSDLIDEEGEQETILPNEEEITHWVEDHVVVYESADEGPCEEAISKNLKLKDEQYPESDSQICVVCQDCLNQEGDKIAGLDCGHDFHAGCITSWLRLKNNCPLCKAPAICL